MRRGKPHPLLVVASLLVGSLLSGYLAREGAISAGHDPTAGWPFPDLTGLTIFVLGALACPVIAVGLINLISRLVPKSPYGVILAALVFSPVTAFPLGASGLRWYERKQARDWAWDDEADRLQLAKRAALEARLISDPELALRERWFEWRRDNEEIRYIFTKTLEEQQVPYSIPQLARIYQEAPEARVLVVAHRSCDAAFLADHWNLALNQPQADGAEILAAIASNPKTPQVLLEDFETSSRSSQREIPEKLRHVLDARLHGDELLMSARESIKAVTGIGRITIHADSVLRRSCEWENATRWAILEARRESSTNGSVLYFHGFNEDSSQYQVTRRIEFREGRRNFQTMEEAVGWIHQQSARIPTVYRNDGLLISSGVDHGQNQLTVELWQVLIHADRPSVLPGADDTKITLTKPDAED